MIIDIPWVNLVIYKFILKFFFSLFLIIFNYFFFETVIRNIILIIKPVYNVFFCSVPSVKGATELPPPFFFTKFI